METYGKSGTVVIMKLACGPVTEYQDGLKEATVSAGSGESKKVDMCNKQITLNAQYGKPEDNSFSIWTPSAKLEMTLTNPSADIFRPGKQYKVTIEEWKD